MFFTTLRNAAGALSVAFLLAATPARAVVVGGGGGASTDCLAVFEAPANHPADAPREVRCVDGDPACDADGLIDGVCTVQVAVCINSTALTGCSLAGVQGITVAHALDNGDPRFDPDFQAVQNRVDNDLVLPSATADECTGAASIRVPIKGPLGRNRCARRAKKLVLTTTSTPMAGRSYTDTDVLKVACEPAPSNGCDPQTLFGGTFDRIQRQIFNQSCAVSGCHDSNSQAGSLLLESGATPGNLVGVNPVNGAALAAGWKRVDVVSPTLGLPESSFLYRKVTGELPGPGFGERMPYGRPKLNRTLRDILEKWIRAGAPATGWVPGTF